MTTYSDIEVGDSFQSERFISTSDVRAFAAVTGDDNPLHVDEKHARASRFGSRVVHGAFLWSLISKVLGRDFPGPGSVAVGGSCRFLRPVPVDSSVTLQCAVSAKVAKRKHVKMRVSVYCKGQRVLVGESTVVPPSG